MAGRAGLLQSDPSGAIIVTLVICLAVASSGYSYSTNTYTASQEHYYRVYTP